MAPDTVLELLETLKTYGVVAHLEAGELKMTAARKPPRGLLAAGRAHKASLLRTLAHVAPDGESVHVVSVRAGATALVVWEWDTLEACPATTSEKPSPAVTATAATYAKPHAS